MTRLSWSKILRLHFKMSARYSKISFIMAVVTLLQAISSLVLLCLIFNYRGDYENTLGDLLRPVGLLLIAPIVVCTSASSVMFFYQYFTKRV